MPEQFIINGQKPLNGVVEISGAKNNAGPVLAATLLTKEPCVIDNLPLVEDVLNIIKMLESLGAEVEWLGEKKIRITAGEQVLPEKLDLSLISKTRASVLLIGPLLARFDEFKFRPPGGDKIGLRPITTHIDALGKLGARVKRENSDYWFEGRNLKPAKIVLKEFSVTATENLMMAAARIEGKTIIKGAATEPHVQDLARMLNKMGAKITGIASHSLEIEGNQNLKGVEHSIIPEHLEVGTFFVAGALTPGTLEIKNLNWNDLDIFLARMEEMGASFEKKSETLKVHFSPDLKAIKLQALPWPGFPTDLLSIVVPLLTQAEGRSLIHDPLYESRLNFINELRKMGADIEIVDPHRAFVFGKTPLFGIKISSWDIRAGACLLLAALAAKGETILENVYQIDRGYEKIDEKLRKVGADIKRIRV